MITCNCLEEGCNSIVLAKYSEFVPQIKITGFSGNKSITKKVEKKSYVDISNKYEGKCSKPIQLTCDHGHVRTYFVETKKDSMITGIAKKHKNISDSRFIQSSNFYDFIPGMHSGITTD